MRELSLNVMDIVQNSIRAGASLTTIRIDESVPGDTLAITVTDNGCGMSEEQVKSVIDPFFTTRTTRKVGLGVPLFKMEAEMTGGSFSVALLLSPPKEVSKKGAPSSEAGGTA